jgi:hypothetical protein
MNLNLEGELVGITPSDKLRLASYEDHLKVVTVDPTSGNIESTRNFPAVTSTNLKWNQVGSHFAVRSDDAIEVWSVEKASRTSDFPPSDFVCAISADGDVVATFDWNDGRKMNLRKHGWCRTDFDRFGCHAVDTGDGFLAGRSLLRDCIA